MHSSNAHNSTTVVKHRYSHFNITKAETVFVPYPPIARNKSYQYSTRYIRNTSHILPFIISMHVVAYKHPCIVHADRMYGSQ